MKNTRIPILLLLAAICQIMPAAGRRSLNFYHLGAKAGLSQVTINGLYQDENDILWIGTKDGVKYYDGNKVEPLNLQGMNDWIASSFVPTICGDGKGHLFINTDYNIVEYDLRYNTSKIIFSQHNTSAAPAIALRYGNDALWIGLRDSIFVYRRDSVRHFTTLDDPRCEISVLCPAGETLYAGTKNNGLFRIDNPSAKQQLLARSSEIIAIFEDAAGTIWCGTFSDGIFRIDAEGRIDNLRQGTSENSLSSNYVRAFAQDTQGNIWAGTSNGLNIIARESGAITRYGLSRNGKTGLSNLSIWAILRDRQGTMWLGSYYGGLDYCNFDSDRFEHFDFGFNAGNGYSVISTIAEDKRGDLWLGTESNGLLFVDGRTKAHEFHHELPASRYNIKSLHYDAAKDILWIGTHQGGLFSYDIQGKRTRQYTINPNDQTTRSESLLDIEAYGNGLFIGTLQGVYYMDFANNTIAPVDELKRYIFEANRILVSSRGDVWIAGNKLCRFNPATGIVREFCRELQQSPGTAKLTTTALFEDAEGNICIGTAGAGLLIFDSQTETFARYHKNNCGLACNYVGDIFQTQSGSLLVATSTGLSYLDKERMQSYDFSSDNGFPLHSMLPGYIFRKSDTNEIVLGGINGMAVTTEQNLLAGGEPIRLFLSNLYVNNQKIAVDDVTKILREAFLFTESISLGYSQNNIAIELGNNNLSNLGQPLCSYRLDGFDKEWIPYAPHTPIRYTNLPYGKYRFRARAEFPGHANGRETLLQIRIRPPVYATWYAYTFYVVFIAGMILWTTYFYRSRLLLRTSLELERRDKKHIEAINGQKLRFFGNISHELRTPLTLIMGQLELLLMSGRLDDELYRKIGEVHNGAKKMKSLINELLDLMKFDQGGFRLKVAYGDIVAFASGIYSSFSALAELKGIELTFTTALPELKLWFDEVQIQKVFNNLLSNAFKYTPRGGKIGIDIRPGDNGTVTISVSDNGIGIPEEMQERIFDRFFQVDNQINHDVAQTGTGIGLSLTRHILHAHHGTIGVESAKGKGCTFTLQLSCDERLFDNDGDVDICEAREVQPVTLGPKSREFLESAAIRQHEESTGEHTILIVEDDAVLRKMLTQIFEPLYNVLEAGDGEQGFDIAVKHAPDIILSDVMMPLLPGDEFCRRIKTNFDTCHIPVVLLTALDGLEHNLQGLNCGADDYITKPFDVRLLVTRCMNILRNRRLMQCKFNGGEDSSPQLIATNSIDQEFISSVIGIIEQNVTTQSVNVSLLCDRTAMSRTKLYNKIKGITGQSPHDFIQSVKLKTAARLLRENGDANISDIAYTLGFSSLNYFGKCFRSAFGISPTAYRKNFEKQRL